MAEQNNDVKEGSSESTNYFYHLDKWWRRETRTETKIIPFNLLPKETITRIKNLVETGFGPIKQYSPPIPLSPLQRGYHPLPYRGQHIFKATNYAMKTYNIYINTSYPDRLIAVKNPEGSMGGDYSVPKKTVLTVLKHLTNNQTKYPKQEDLTSEIREKYKVGVAGGIMTVIIAILCTWNLYRYEQIHNTLISRHVFTITEENKQKLIQALQL